MLFVSDHRESCEACKAHDHCGHPLQLASDLEKHLIEALVNNVLAGLKLGSKSVAHATLRDKR